MAGMQIMEDTWVSCHPDDFPDPIWDDFCQTYRERTGKEVGEEEPCEYDDDE